jgi:hypothetical protein
MKDKKEYLSAHEMAIKLKVSKQTLLNKAEVGMVKPEPFQVGSNKNSPWIFHRESKIL